MIRRNVNPSLSKFFTAANVALLALWLGALFLFSSLPGGSFPSVRIPHIDKVFHFGYFFLGGLLLALLARRTLRWRGLKMFAVVVAVVVVLGAMDERHQSRTPGRSGNDPGDFVADCAGGIAGAIVIGWIYVRKARQRTAAGPREPGDLVAPGD